MQPTALRDALQAEAEAFDEQSAGKLAQATAAVKAGDEAARIQLCAGLLCAAFRHPGATESVYDALTAGWLHQQPRAANGKPGAHPFPSLEDTHYTAGLWQSLWQLLDDSNSMDALNLTARVAALGGTLHPGYGALAERQSHTHPGGAEPHKRTPPPMLDLAQLARAPANSLAGDLHRMLVDNGYDAEVLDRQALGLSALPPGLSYLNTRILQMHDVWHLVAGYRTTSLHEIAISAFQLAQFGHNYSAMFLAVVLVTATIQRPEGLPILLQIISEAWHHGRSNPSFMAIDWEQEWHKSIEVVRAEQQIEPFESTLPADLFESLAQAGAV